jgi:2-dehydro-3-deoxygalactonokinase
MDKFLSCDWGTSTFRIRLVDAVKREACAELKTSDGIAATHQQWLATGRPEAERIDFYRRKLGVAISHLSGDVVKGMPVILSGMASSSIGLAELPYQDFPFSWDLAQFPVKKINEDERFSHPLYLVSGFKTDHDVMRGEESLLLGCDIADYDERIFIFPGTHSKHVFVKNKWGIDFKTYMTGEIFNLLAEKSILSHAVKKGTDEKSFSDGFQAGLDGNLLHHAFMVRTRQLLQHANPVSGYQFLSGLLIGAELGQLKETHCPVYVICGDHLKQAYLTGLKLMESGREIFFLNADEMLVRAHCKIADQFFKNTEYEK